MKEKVLKYSIYVLGAFALTVFVLVRIPTLPQNLLVDLDNYGDLYRLNFVEVFKEELPPKQIAFKHTQKQAGLNEADILIFGDSFFNYRRHKSVPEQLSDSLNKRIHFAQTHLADQYLSRKSYDSTNKKLLVFEIAERGIAYKFNPVPNRQTRFQFNVFNKLDTTLFAELYNKRYRFLLERSILSYKIYSALNTFHFNSLEIISHNTPKYSINPPWLFYKTTVNDNPGSFNYNYTELELDQTASNIKKWKTKITEKYNVDILFVFIPNKSSLYSKQAIDDTYNNYLNRLSNRLIELDVNHLNLYDSFKNQKDHLYYSTDTHWNENGEQIAANLLIEKIIDLNY